AGVQIHIGNNVGQTRGCILPGKAVDPQNCTVSGSAAAIEAIKSAMKSSENGQTCSERPVVVAVEGAPRTTPSSACRDMSACVALEQKALTGPGHCPGELVGWLSNKCNRKVYCSFTAVRGAEKAAPGGVSVAINGRVGGEVGGIWFCGGYTAIQ